MQLVLLVLLVLLLVVLSPHAQSRRQGLEQAAQTGRGLPAQGLLVLAMAGVLLPHLG